MGMKYFLLNANSLNSCRFELLLWCCSISKKSEMIGNKATADFVLEQPWLSAYFFYPYKRDCSADYVEQDGE